MPPISDLPSRRTLLALSGALAAGACSPLTALNAVMPKDAGGQAAGIDIPYGADPRQKLDVYLPQAPTRRAPVVVFVYGGGWSGGSRSDYSFVGRAFAAQGFVTVVPDYRLVPQVRYPSFVEDCAEAVRWAQDNAVKFGGDPRSIHLVGHSAGAYNVAMLGLDRRFLARAGVRHANIRSVSGLSGPYDFLPLQGKESEEAFKGVRDLEATQPINHVSRAVPPFFLATGDADETVLPRNSERLASRLRAVGVPVEFKIYPGLGHATTVLALGQGFRERAPVLADVAGFIRRHAGSAVAARP